MAPSAAGTAPARVLVLVGIISGIVGLVVALGLQVTRAEKELVCFALGAITLLGGVIGLVAAVRLWYNPEGDIDGKASRFPPLGIAVDALAAGIVLIVLGVHAAAAHSHGPAPRPAHAAAIPERDR